MDRPTPCWLTHAEAPPPKLEPEDGTLLLTLFLRHDQSPLREEINAVIESAK